VKVWWRLFGKEEGKTLQAEEIKAALGDGEDTEGGDGEEPEGEFARELSGGKDGGGGEVVEEVEVEEAAQEDHGEAGKEEPERVEARGVTAELVQIAAVEGMEEGVADLGDGESDEVMEDASGDEQAGGPAGGAIGDHVASCVSVSV